MTREIFDARLRLLALNVAPVDVLDSSLFIGLHKHGLVGWKWERGGEFTWRLQATPGSHQQRLKQHGLVA